MEHPNPADAFHIDLLGPDADGRLVVRISGDVDRHAGSRLRDGLWEAIAQRPTQVVVDAMNVVFLGSAAVSTLIRAAERARLDGVGFRIERASPIVHRVLAIVDIGLDGSPQT